MQVSWTKDRRFNGRYPLKSDHRRRSRDRRGDAASPSSEPLSGRPSAGRPITVFGQRHPADYRHPSPEEKRENLYFGLGMMIFFGAIAATAITLYVFLAVNAALFGAG
jgi:hypothetical protein